MVSLSRGLCLCVHLPVIVTASSVGEESEPAEVYPRRPGVSVRKAPDLTGRTTPGGPSEPGSIFTKGKDVFGDPDEYSWYYKGPFPPAARTTEGNLRGAQLLPQDGNVKFPNLKMMLTTELELEGNARKTLSKMLSEAAKLGSETSASVPVEEEGHRVVWIMDAQTRVSGVKFQKNWVESLRGRVHKVASCTGVSTQVGIFLDRQEPIGDDEQTGMLKAELFAAAPDTTGESSGIVSMPRFGKTEESDVLAELKRARMVYFMGGNPRLLMQNLTAKSEIRTYIVDAVRSGKLVFLGNSAGSIVACTNMFISRWSAMQEPGLDMFPEARLEVRVHYDENDSIYRPYKAHSREWRAAAENQPWTEEEIAADETNQQTSPAFRWNQDDFLEHQRAHGNLALPIRQDEFVAVYNGAVVVAPVEAAYHRLEKEQRDKEQKEQREKEQKEQREKEQTAPVEAAAVEKRPGQ